MKLRLTLFLSLIALAVAGAHASFLQHKRKAFSATGSSLLSGLVAYWKLDEASGNRAASVGFTLTDNNTVLDGTGVQGAAANFEGTLDEYLSATDATAGAVDFSGDQSFTIAFWANTETASSDSRAVTKYNATANTRSYQIQFVDAVPDTYVLHVSGDGTAATSVSETAGVSNATWYFVVAWHDADADTINIMIDNASPVSAAHTGGVFNSSASFIVGARADALTANTFDGLIDEIGIWNRVLTTEERTALYNSGAGITYPF